MGLKRKIKEKIKQELSDYIDVITSTYDFKITKKKMSIYGYVQPSTRKMYISYWKNREKNEFGDTLIHELIHCLNDCLDRYKSIYNKESLVEMCAKYIAKDEKYLENIIHNVQMEDYYNSLKEDKK